MTSSAPPEAAETLHVGPVDKDNWRGVAALEVAPEQGALVATPSYYLALCCYGGSWRPLAVSLGAQVIGFCMWGLDEDGSCWLGGVLIDVGYQGRGYGKRAVEQTLATLNETHGYRDFALSYAAENVRAKRLYASLGFDETGEYEGDELVARLRLR